MDIDWSSVKDSAGSLESINDLDNITEIGFKSSKNINIKQDIKESIQKLISDLKKKYS